MAKKTNLILSVDENDLNLFQKQYLNAADIRDEIERLETEESGLDKRKKEYKLWKDKINFLMDMYNVKVGWKAYKKIP